jgi:hypothetical protein
MKMQLAVILACALAAGPAAAQGTFSPGRKAPSDSGSSLTKPPSYGVPARPGPSASKPRTYGAPEAPKAPGFEPYKPFSGSSVYSRPNGAPRQDPCKTSVYTNACDKGR